VQCALRVDLSGDLDTTPPVPPHVAVSRSGVAPPMRPENVRRDFRKAIKNAPGVDAEDWTPREFRHSFVSLLSDSDMPVEEISRLVGHKNTTRDRVGLRQADPARPATRGRCHGPHLQGR
jgi:integrase